MKELPLILSWLMTLLLTFDLGGCLDNGLALTPPMGWMTGQRYGCNIDCVNYPNDCLNEQLIRTQADLLVKDGYHQAGYNYVLIGDCWSSRQRDSGGRLQPDKSRFPSGIKALADYVHGKGLKLGLFLELGNETVHGYPGSQGHLQTDAQTLAAWGLDMVTMDAHSVKDVKTLDTLFPQFGQYLNQTGRPILYDCRWPIYQKGHGPEPNWPLISKTCNIFKLYPDMEDSWVDLLVLIKYFADNGRKLVNYTGPGAWNDVDQVTVGNYGLSYQQQRMELALWSALAGPLFVSADLQTMRQDSKDLLLNPLLLNMSQDGLAQMGYQKMILQSNGQVRVWVRPVRPQGSYLLVFSYENISGGPAKVVVKLQDLGLTHVGKYEFIDVFKRKSLGKYKPWYEFNGEVNPTGVLCIFAKALPIDKTSKNIMPDIV